MSSTGVPSLPSRTWRLRTCWPVLGCHGESQLSPDMVSTSGEVLTSVSRV